MTWQQKNPKKWRRYQKRWLKENWKRRRAWLRRHRLLKTYGITEKQYDAQLKKQAGTCAICRRPPKTRRLCVDHDHRTKRVRGLLCSRCNRGLNWFADRPDLLRKAAKYLTHPPFGPS